MAAIILVINFNGAQARKRENERFDKRAASPPFVLPSRFPTRPFLSTLHFLPDIPLNPTSNQGTHVCRKFWYTQYVLTSENIKSVLFTYLFSLFISLFSFFLSVSLDSLQKGLNIFNRENVLPPHLHSMYFSALEHTTGQKTLDINQL